MAQYTSTKTPNSVIQYNTNSISRFSSENLIPKFDLGSFENGATAQMYSFMTMQAYNKTSTQSAKMAQKDLFNECENWVGLQLTINICNNQACFQAKSVVLIDKQAHTYLPDSQGH